MAALVCDLCGGKLVMGAGGIAVCDSCGMEYSTERMREKVQMIKGSVQIDNSNMDLQRVAKSHLLKSILGLLRKSRKQNQIFRYRIFACLILGVLQMNGVLADTTRWWSTGKKGRRIEACP